MKCILELAAFEICSAGAFIFGHSDFFNLRPKKICTPCFYDGTFDSLFRFKITRPFLRKLSRLRLEPGEIFIGDLLICFAKLIGCSVHWVRPELCFSWYFCHTSSFLTCSHGIPFEPPLRK